MPVWLPGIRTPGFRLQLIALIWDAAAPRS